MIETSHKQIIWDSIVCLIVDDDKFSRTFVKTALYQIGIKNTKEAGNTEEAAELLHNFKIDVILLDQQMPNQSGLEFARELKSGKIDGAKNCFRCQRIGHSGIFSQTDFSARPQKKNLYCIWP